MKKTMPPENLALRKLTVLPAGNLALPQSTVPPENLASVKSTVPENSAPLNSTVPPENSASAKLPPSKTTPVKSKSKPRQTLARFYADER